MVMYQYSRNDDFPDSSNIQISDLSNTIRQEFSANYLGIKNNQVTVFIKFNTSLSAGEKTTLDGIIASHNPIIIQEINPQHNLIATTDPATGNDETQNFEFGSLWKNSTSNEIFMCSDPTQSTAVWKQITNPSRSSLPMNVVFGNSNGQPITIDSANYVVVSNFIYKGTDNESSITEILATVEVDSPAIGQIKIYDFTNKQVIATSSTFNNTIKNMINLGTISNLPTTQSIIEIQVRKTSGKNNKFVKLFNVHFYN